MSSSEESTRTGGRRAHRTPEPEFAANDFPCDLHGHRIARLESRAEDHSDTIRLHSQTLSDGRVQFAEIRKDLASVSAAINSMSTNINRAVWIIVTAVMVAVLGLVLGKP